MRYYKTLVTICAVLLTVTLMAMPKAGVIEDQTISISGDPVIIPIWENGSTVVEGTPRNVPPFSAEYYSLLSGVLLSSQDITLGNVSVTLSSTAGDWYQTVFDTSNGSILLPVSGESGHYTLTLVTSGGTTYIGEFVL